MCRWSRMKQLLNTQLLKAWFTLPLANELSSKRFLFLSLSRMDVDQMKTDQNLLLIFCSPPCESPSNDARQWSLRSIDRYYMLYTWAHDGPSIEMSSRGNCCPFTSKEPLASCNFSPLLTYFITLCPQLDTGAHFVSSLSFTVSFLCYCLFFLSQFFLSLTSIPCSLVHLTTSTGHPSLV